MHGQIYEHYKGGRYTLLFIAFNSTNSADREEMAVYVSHTTGGIFVRKKEEFQELVTWPNGDVLPRFHYVGHYQRPVKPS